MYSSHILLQDHFPSWLLCAFSPFCTLCKIFPELLFPSTHLLFQLYVNIHNFERYQFIPVFFRQIDTLVWYFFSASGSCFWKHFHETAKIFSTFFGFSLFFRTIIYDYPCIEVIFIALVYVEEEIYKLHGNRQG
jgi:hypothetical protein